LNPNVTGWLVYDDSKPKPEAKAIDSFDAQFDDFALVPYDKEALYSNVDQSITLDMKMDNLNDGANYAFFNDITYVAPKVPTLYTVLSTGANATNPIIYGQNTNAFVLAQNQVVEIILNNDDPGKHPFHLHGHAFQVVARSEEEAGAFDANNSTQTAFATTPMRRDTVLVRPNGHIVLRFQSNNPGIWLFVSLYPDLHRHRLLTYPQHCHLEWHMASGLAITMVEAPLALQAQLGGKIPQDHLDTCKAGNVPTAGNAAGNTIDLLDLAGENTSPGPLPAGFTARGIVALVFSCISAFLGMGVIGWYGLKPVGGKKTV
jgi:iron transport multicopper oxidase